MVKRKVKTLSKKMGRPKSEVIRHTPDAEALAELDNDEELTAKQKAFCKEYIWDYNGKRAAIVAGYAEHTAEISASKLLRVPKVSARIAFLKSNVQEATGVTRDRIVKEHERLAFSSIAHMHLTWIELKEFESLTDDQKASIRSVLRRVRKVPGQKKGTFDEIEEVRIELYDKQRSLDSLSKIIGIDAATKIDITSNGGSVAPVTINVYNTAPPLAGSESEIEGRDKIIEI